MRGRRRGYSWGWVCVCAGIVIILALIMPTGFWWFALAASLICFGIKLLRCR